MIITDLSQTTPINEAVKLDDAALHKSIKQCLSVVTTGTISAGTPKLTVSQDGTNFYPLNDENGEQIELESGTVIFLHFANLYLKVDLTGVTSSDLKVAIQ